jgi:hypothetical protein
MDRREQEALAVLGLILSVSFLIWSIFYLRNAIPSQVIGEQIIQMPPSKSVKQYTEKEMEIMNVAQGYGNRILQVLVTSNNDYEYVFLAFDAKTREEFNYSRDKFREALQNIFGRLGVATGYSLENQMLFYSARDPSMAVVQNTYIVRYPEMSPRILEMFIGEKNGKFEILRINFEIVK